MGQFLNGLFIGFGVGLFIAPQTGEETRRMIMERVVALRKSMVSENEQHFSIEAHPSQVPPLAAQPATDFSSEPQVQGITSESAAQPATEFFSEPEDCDWLRSTHLVNLSLVPPFQSFILEGNSDCPDVIVLYDDPNPFMNDPCTTYARQEDGSYKLQD